MTIPGQLTSFLASINCPLSLDAACWLLFDVVTQVIQGMVVGHVDDFLFGGNERAWRSLEAIGKELGFGSLEEGSFVWCGKRMRKVGTRVTVDMETYVKNLAPVPIRGPAERSRTRASLPTSCVSSAPSAAACNGSLRRCGATSPLESLRCRQSEAVTGRLCLLSCVRTRFWQR